MSFDDIIDKHQLESEGMPPMEVEVTTDIPDCSQTIIDFHNIKMSNNVIADDSNSVSLTYAEEKTFGTATFDDRFAITATFEQPADITVTLIE